MSPRLPYRAVAPDGYKALLGLESYLATTGLEPILLDLVRLRASQLNGCAYCLDMHSKDLRAHGETEQRIYVLGAWRETPFFSERERAALAWTEAVTRLPGGAVPDDVYDEARAHFSDKELVDLTIAVATINAWNRIAIAFRPEVGGYQPARARGQSAA